MHPFAAAQCHAPQAAVLDDRRDDLRRLAYLGPCRSGTPQQQRVQGDAADHVAVIGHTGAAGRPAPGDHHVGTVTHPTPGNGVAAGADISVSSGYARRVFPTRQV